MESTTVYGVVRGTAHGVQPDDATVAFKANPNCMQIVAPGLPERTELTRLGRSWWTKNTTAAAALPAPPTTTSGLTLYNGESSGSTIHYIIDSVCAAEIVVDATQQNQTQLWVA